MKSLTPDTRALVLARMVRLAPEQKLGRTAVMKLMYFLQELKGIPLGYDFSLYTYGPFDADVLNDLGVATAQDLVREDVVLYPCGYGYDITLASDTPGSDQELLNHGTGLVEAIDAVVAEFGSFGAADLELLSTIFFVDRELMKNEVEATADIIAERVQKIKPHFTKRTILSQVKKMNQKGWLQSLSALSSDS